MNNNKKIAFTCLLVLLTFFVVTSGWKNKKETLIEANTLKPVIEQNSLSNSPPQIVETINANISPQKEKPAALNIVTAKKTVNSKLSTKKRNAQNTSKKYLDKSKYVKLVAFSELKIGKKCSTGGYKIEEGYDVNMNEQLEASEITTTKFVCEESKYTKVAEINPNKNDFFEVSVIKNTDESK